MSIYINIVSIIIGVGIFIITFRNMIHKKINERQSIIWLLVGVSVTILGIFPPLLMWLADLLGVWYPPTIMFAAAFAGLLLIVYHHTITISVLNNKVQELSLQLALIREEQEESHREPVDEKQENIGDCIK